MHVLVVAQTLRDVGERSLHPALGRGGMGTLGWHERQHDYAVPPAFRGNAEPQSGEAPANDQHIGVDDIHCTLLRIAALAVGSYGLP
jgi:hypothetical protein